MKVWADLTGPERTMRRESRELDLLSVGYLLVRSPPGPTSKATPPPAPEIPATENYGGHKFTKGNLGLPDLNSGERLSFTVRPTETRNLAMTTALAFSENASDGTVVAHVRLQANDGTSFEFDLRAGEHSSEWAIERADMSQRIKHKRAPVATSYRVTDAQPNFDGHDYVASFELPATAVISGGEVSVEPVPDAPQLSLNVGRISLSNGDRVVAIQKEAITLVRSHQSLVEPSSGPRWKHIADVGPVAIFENNRALPRAWLVSGERIAADAEQLQVIRTGKAAAETKWDPRTEALVKRPTGVAFPKEKPPPGTTEIIGRTPNRVEIETESSTPSLLVLADNFYPGWRA